VNNIDAFLALFKNVRPHGTNKWMACCPAHNDGQHQGDQSLSVTLAGDRILLKCFAGCATPDIVKTLGLTMSDLFIGEKQKKEPATKQSRMRREIETIYPYHDLGNKLVFEVVRYKPKAFSQRRPDGQGGYINNLNGIERVIYRLPLITAAIQRGEVIYHVEGEKDANNLVKLGLEATTSPQGAGNWKPAMAEYYTGAGTVVIIPDKDPAGRAYAADVAADVFTQAKHIKILELPGEGIKDASDWIAAGGTREKLEDLAKFTPEYWPPAGPPEEIDYDAIRSLLRKESDGQYTVINGKFHKIVHTREGETVDLPLCNFVARVTEDILKDNGAAQERFLRVQGRLNGSHLAHVTVPDLHFDNMNWVRKAWGVKAQTEKSIDKVERHLAQCIIKSSGKVPEHTIYTHTGWRDIDGQMVYLTGSGATGRPEMEVELPPRLARYKLPQPDGDVKEAVSKSMELLSIADMRVTLPTFVMPYLAVLNVFEDMAFTVWYVGRSGSLKSVMTALALSHFGNFTHKSLPVNWFGTRTELEKLSFHAKDILFAIDDYAPPANPAEARELTKTVEYILRAYGNRQGKVRANPDMTSQETFFPRGLLVTSGEQLPPPGVSRSARILPVPISIDDFYQDGKDNYYLLTQAQKDRKYYPVAMAHFIRWIQANWKAVDDKLHSYYERFSLEANKKDVHLRLIETICLMQAGFNIFLDFAADHGAIKSVDIGGHLQMSWEIFTGLLKYQSTRITSERPGERFIEVIKSLLSSGKAILRNRNDTGAWYPAEAGPGQAIIGWDDIDAYNHDGEGVGIIYLNPEEAFSAVFKHCMNIGEFYGHTKESTWDDMNSLNYLEDTGEEGSRSMLKKKMIGNIQKRLLWLKRNVIYDAKEF
jgi:hypothetical protein